MQETLHAPPDDREWLKLYDAQRLRLLDAQRKLDIIRAKEFLAHVKLRWVRAKARGKRLCRAARAVRLHSRIPRPRQRRARVRRAMSKPASTADPDPAEPDSSQRASTSGGAP